MFYILTNIGAWLLILTIVGISSFFDRKNFRQISILAITVSSLIVALSVVLTNLVGYNIPIQGGIKLALGNFLIFILGMLFGPFMGTISGVASDILGSLVNIQGSYHAGFTLNVVLYGFMGSLVFIFKNHKLWQLKAAILYIITFAFISFVLNVLWLYSIGWNTVIVGAAFIIKLIKLPIEMLIYLPLTFASFILLYKLITGKHNLQLWCLRYGEISLFFHKKYSKKPAQHIL